MGDFRYLLDIADFNRYTNTPRVSKPRIVIPDKTVRPVEVKKEVVVEPAPVVELGGPQVKEWRDSRFRDLVLDAQLQAESNFDPNAKSWAGAEGIAQFMPKTWDWAIQKGWAKEGSKPTDVDSAVYAQFRYMDRAYNLPQVKSAKTEEERIRRTLAAYNAGEGTLRKALKVAEIKGTHWEKELPRPQETVPYMDKIMKNVNSNLNNITYQPKFDRTQFTN